MGSHTSNMLHLTMLLIATFVLAGLKAPFSEATGQTQTIKIHVPHSVHHHTHTKYQFIPVPMNRTTPAPTTILPVMPVLPAAPGTAPVPGFQPGVLAPGQPGAVPIQPGVFQPGFPQGNVPPGFQNQLPGGGAVPAGFPPVQGQIPVGFPVFQGQAPAGFPQAPGQMGAMFPGQLPQPGFFGGNPAMYVNGDYEYIDMTGKQLREKADGSSKPQKYRTIINIQETKSIPLSELLDLSTMLNNKDAPRSIKVDVADKSYVRHSSGRQSKNNWSSNLNSIKSSSHYDIDRVEHNPETVLYEQTPTSENSVNLAPWMKVRELLEKHINQDFPGLKIKAEIVPASREKDEPERETALVHMDDTKRPIGYIVFGDSNNRRYSEHDDVS